MRYPVAIWYPGPADKQNGGTNSVEGVTMHSMVGSITAALGELEKPERRASWQFSVLQDGRVFQHYETDVQAWHAGSSYNDTTVGIEHEGGLSPYDEPLTPAQLAASVALVRWLSQAHSFPMERFTHLHEHNEVSGAPTSCPSNRIPWDAYTDEGGRMYTDAEIDAKVAEALALGVRTQTNLGLLANATDVLPSLKGQLRYLWALRGKAWPF